MRKVHIGHIYSRKEEDKHVYYLKMDYPPKFFGVMLHTKLSQDVAFINTWQRIQNFTLLDHDMIKDNQFLRLHLFNNVTIRIECRKKLDERSKDFLEELFKEMSGSFQSHPATFS